jgi:subtilisin family serine protease
MKNYFLLFLVLIAAACGKEPTITTSEATAVVSSLRYTHIVILNQKVGTPLLSTQMLAEDKEGARQALIQKIHGFCQANNIQNVADSMIFTDINVGFVAHLEAGQDSILALDDAVIEVRPDIGIRSVDPIGQRDPIQQKDPIQQTEWDLVAGSGGCTLATYAVERAGGSVAATNPKKIYILDTGVDQHDYLNVLQSESRNFVIGETKQDKNGHGTHVAGIAAAKKAMIGPALDVDVCAGVSAGAPIVSLKVLDKQGHGQWSYLYLAFERLGRKGTPGDIVNMSLGAYCVDDCQNFDTQIDSAITALADYGLFIVMAAGNDSGYASKNFPGCINHTRVFTVGSIDRNGECSFYSNYDAGVVDWVAVGTNVVSTYKNNKYAVMSGTSMSTALVTGIIHSRNDAPISEGTVTCSSATYNIAKR